MGLYRRGQSVNEPIGDFSPDQDPVAAGISLDMDQAQPSMKGFQALNSAQPYIAQALTETPNGATISYYSNGQTQIWAGGTAHLWRQFGALWIQVDQQGATSFGATSRWRFAQFNDDLIAVAAGVMPQVATGAAGIFTPLGGTPPNNANIVIAVNGQVMMFQGPNWYVSALTLDNNWTPNIQTQAGSGTLYDYPGSIVAAAPIFRNVVACKNQATWLGTYVGGQAVWSWQLVSDQTGAWSQESMVTLPDAVAWIGTDDFYICQGYTPQRIPNHLKEWFFDNADPTQLSNAQGRYDPYHGIIWWYFVSKNTPTASQCDRYINYNVRIGRWGTGRLQTPCVPSPNAQPGLVLGFYFDTSNVLQSYTGAPGTMRLLTGYYGDPARMSQLLAVRPEYNVAPVTATLQAYHTPILASGDTVGPAGVLSAGGWFYLRQYDRYHRVQLTVNGSQSAITSNTDVGAEVTALAFRFREGGAR